MTDNDFNVNKNEYPLDIIYVPDKNGGYLIEGGDISKKYIPISSYQTITHSSLYLQIVCPITYDFSVGNFHGSTIYTKAEMINLDDNSISFFGTDRKIERMSVDIYPGNEVMQLQFRGGLSERSIDIEEYIQISLAVPNSQFEGIMRLWDHDNIDEIFLSLKKEIINGLYMLDTCAPWDEFKVLPDKKMVKNYQDLPENFSDFKNFETYYVSNDCFKLTIRKKKLLKTNEEQNHEHEEDYFTKEDVIKNDIQEKNQIALFNKLNEIKEYTRYAVVIITAILIIILFKY